MALTLSTNTDCTELIVTQSLIELGETTSPLYTSITITVYKNCCDCTGYSIPITLTENIPISPGTNYTMVGKVITLLPTLLGAGVTVFPDGVYKVIITGLSDVDINGIDEVATESNCFFMDCSTSCAVAKYIKGLLKTPADVEAHLLHFGLTNGGNCNCNCDEMCYLYKKLYDIINDTDICLCNCT